MTVSEWLYLPIATTKWRNEGDPVEDTLQDALFAMGTNALPTLLKMMASSDGPLKSRLIKLVNGQRIVRVRIHTADEKIFHAFRGFSILGSNAVPAVPELLKLAKNKEPAVRRFSLHSIFLILRHDDVVRSAFTEALKDPDRRVGEWAASIIKYEFPEDAERLGVYKLYPKLNPLRTNAVSAPAIR